MSKILWNGLLFFHDVVFVASMNNTIREKRMLKSLMESLLVHVFELYTGLFLLLFINGT